ncbi:MAG: phosphoribosylformylglycinamidine synthase subunit PurL [Candidatus Omnitrophica bacterium]|nr:phosphoribosylformylglycinamidine synthase subunit PurL [Candidatus Omnitrophota bacterium]
MIWRAEIKEKAGVFDPAAAGIKKDVGDLGLADLDDVRIVQVYTIEGELNAEQAELIAAELLTDKVTQEYYLCAAHEYTLPTQLGDDDHVVEIAYNNGVMDPVEYSTLKGIRDLGIETAKSVRTAKQYHLKGKISDPDLKLIVEKVLSNKLIQHVVKGFAAPLKVEPRSSTSVKVIMVDMLKATDKELMKLSQSGQLFLNIAEMKQIQNHFKKLGRNPTDIELETVAQTWSEHCHHKTFRGNIRYRVKEGSKTKTKMIRSLLKSTIAKATYDVNKSWCVSVFHDNAGVIKFDKDHHVCFKVETHNHPSALEPFGGANTGIGGVIRDILGTGLGAKPICNTDVFCFAPPDTDFKDLPAGTLHPKRVMKGVVSGVRDYGNKMGIPTVNGAVLFDEGFIGNPLVFCGTVGLLPKGMGKKKTFKGDYIVVAGGRTGRDGIHGATFSSGELTDESETVSSGAVQIGHPIQEKKVLDVLLKARDKGLYSAITDCGAGGLSSAVGEMGQHLGATVHLDKVPLKYQGLSYYEIWISESQERMVMSVPPQKADALLKLFAAENVEATVIGQFDNDGQLKIFYNDVQVCDIAMEFLHEGIPDITKEAFWALPKLKDPKFACPSDLNDSLFDALSHLNVASKEWIIRQYDHEVQGASIIKPLVGKHQDGPSDAAVVTPKLGSSKAIAVSNGVNFRFGKIDPFWMAAGCIDEAIRQVICVGGDVNKIALLDNFCWGNPDKPDRLGGLVRCAEGCYKAAVAYGTPFISGKDSLYNEFASGKGKETIAIPGTILISAIGIIDDVRKCLTMDFKQAGNLIYVVGDTLPELGGSIYYANHDAVGQDVPLVNFKTALKTFESLSAAVKSGLIRSMHDCSEGGLGVALAEMAFSGGFGVSARLDKVPVKGKVTRNDFVLFSESHSRFVVEVAPERQKAFEKAMGGLPFAMIGRVEATPEFIVYGLDQKVCVNADIADLKEAWQQPLRW